MINTMQKNIRDMLNKYDNRSENKETLVEEENQMVAVSMNLDGKIEKLIIEPEYFDEDECNIIAHLLVDTINKCTEQVINKQQKESDLLKVLGL